MSLYRRPNSGFWWVRFTIGGRRIRQSTGTANRSQAEEYETALRNRLWRQTRLGESNHTFQEAVEKYLAETTKKSKEWDRSRLDWFLQNETLAALPLRELGREVLDAARGRLDGALSPATVNHYMGTLRALLRKSQEWGWINQAPKVPMARVRLKDPRWLTRGQFGRLAKSLPSHSADLARFAVATGLRRANITGLTWDRVDLKRRTIYIPGSQAKAGKGIPVALNSDAVEVLKRWKGKDLRWVFVFRGKPVYQVTTATWRRACVKAGVPGFRFHDLRHTWASWQVQAGTPLLALQEMGGWASFEMVRRYAHLSPGHLRQYAEHSRLAHKRPHRTSTKT